ncbi:hypothetical protein [Arthrobacter sp. TE12232]
MTTVQRRFSVALRHRRATRHWGTQSSHEAAVAEVRPSAPSSRITAAPWEGLYLEVDKAAESGVAPGA